MTALRVEVRARPPAGGPREGPASAPGAGEGPPPHGVTGLRLQERAAASTCAYCHDPLPHARHDCGCGAAYHRDCWAELGRCATLGCAGRADADDRRRGGRCPQCHTSVSQALPWERLGCGGCGAVYHLGCRLHRSRCATRGCQSGDHDGWGAPRVPARPPLLTPERRALLVRALMTNVVAAATTLGLVALTDELLVSGVTGAIMAVLVAFASSAEPAPGPRLTRARREALVPRRIELPGRVELLRGGR